MVNSWKYFKINLFNAHASYIAGQSVVGTIEICVMDRVKINGIKLRLVGQGKVNWTEKKGNGRFETTVTYTDSENYIDYLIQMLPKQNGSDLYLEIGKYCFPFEIKLPATLPTSFEHLEGRIRYLLCCTIEIPWSLNKTYKLPITIISLLDLNAYPRLKSSESINNSKTICCFCCKSKPIFISFSLYKIGYVCGEAIVFNASINNQSSRKIPIVLLKMNQIIKFHTRAKVKTTTREVTHIVFNKEILPFTKENWDNSVLSIPAVCPSSYKTSKLIEISYNLVLYIEPKWPSTSITLKIPIIIGTRPFKQTYTEEMSDLPTYQECVFGMTNSTENFYDNENNDVSFVPLYPSYPANVNNR